jgi:hypothetical protein
MGRDRYRDPAIAPPAAMVAVKKRKTPRMNVTPLFFFSCSSVEYTVFATRYISEADGDFVSPIGRCVYLITSPVLGSISAKLTFSLNVLMTFDTVSALGSSLVSQDIVR